MNRKFVTYTCTINLKNKLKQDNKFHEMFTVFVDILTHIRYLYQFYTVKQLSKTLRIC